MLLSGRTEGAILHKTCNADEVAFRVRVWHEGRWLLGKLDSCLKPLQLKLKLPALVFKRKSVFLVQITAHCRTAEVTCQHTQRSRMERPQLSQKEKKNPSDSCWQLIELTLFFCAYPCCHSPVYWHYISWKPPRDCIITLTGDSTVLLQHWLTFCISTLEQRLHWLLLR